MMKVAFTDDEMLVLAMYRADSRHACLSAMKDTMSYSEQDPLMAELLRNLADKVSQITDDEYLRLKFTEYEIQLDELAAKAESEEI